MHITLAKSTSVSRVKFSSRDIGYLVVEILDDDLIHFELSRVGNGPRKEEMIYTTPQVFKKDYLGPEVLKIRHNIFETKEIRVTIDQTSLCIKAFDLKRNYYLTTICPFQIDHPFKGLTIDQGEMKNVYGLGQKFRHKGEANGDWVGAIRYSGPQGNVMEGFHKGAIGNTQIPIMYALGDSLKGWALFLDNIYKQTWNFKKNPWKVEMWGDQIRFYLMSGATLQDLRRDYMQLTGRPIVPPKKLFGLWVSEYGYDNWEEIQKNLNSLREAHFPIDGFLLDLQWFGGILNNSDLTPMGTLTWDRQSFPNPKENIERFSKKEGVGIILIEEPYIGRGLYEHQLMDKAGYLARECENLNCPSSYITYNPWWGKGGLIDWSNPYSCNYWHNWKRKSLIDDGIIGHWLDLGEPEMYHQHSWYYGFPKLGKFKHTDIHNVYSLLWQKGIFDGYKEQNEAKRPFILARSTAAGGQRYGLAMWSGDIASNLKSYATQMNVQMHMSLSGIDYYGSDIGGFHRNGLEGNLNELYTQWLASSAFVDIPVRPHVGNPENNHETAPSRIGDIKSNLKNIQTRYELIPYYYSLAHEAFLKGDPLFPPPLFYFQKDKTLRSVGHQKMIGRWMMICMVAAHNQTTRSIYLPQGKWYDYYTHQSYQILNEDGKWINNLPLYDADKIFKVPLMVREGAIIPKMYIDKFSMNSEGGRLDGLVRDELILRIYPSKRMSEFTLYEDDGKSNEYLKGNVRQTRITQQLKDNNKIEIVLHASQGNYKGALDYRRVLLEIVIDCTKQLIVSINGKMFNTFKCKEKLFSIDLGKLSIKNTNVIDLTMQQGGRFAPP